MSGQLHALAALPQVTIEQVRPQAWVCGLSHAGIAGSNPVGGIGVCLLCVVSLRRADNSSRGVLKSVLCVNERDHEASVMRRACFSAGSCAMGGGL